jgi:uncharacterized membrane protein
MRDPFSRQASLLSYLGVLPLIFCAAAIIAGYYPDEMTFIQRAYGAVIVSFISGIHWGLSMKDHQRKTIWLLTTSNVIALLAWGSLLMHHAISAFATLTLAFIILLMIDRKLYRLGHIEPWFIKLRHRLTLLVTIALFATGVAVV